MDRAAFLLVQWTRRLVAAVLLLVVAAHAAAPIGQPLERAAGSAFSAATDDVSLACGQSAAVAKRVALAGPVAAIVAARPAPVEDCLALAGRDQRYRPPATGPPPLATLPSPLNPRAPPAA